MPPVPPPATELIWTPRQGPAHQLPVLPPLARSLSDCIPEIIVGQGITLCCGRVLYSAQIRASAAPCLVLCIEDAAFRSPEHRAKFLAGMAAVRAFAHPHLLPLLWIGEREGCVCLGYEAFTGQALPDLMNQFTLPPPLVVSIAGAIGDVLHRGQQQGIIHRDLGSPGILVNQAGFAKLVGIGLSPLLIESDKDYLDTVLQRPHFLRAWLPPELMNLSAPGDHLSDIYSLGAITYEMLVGNPPSGFAMPPSSRAAVGTFVDQVVFRALHSTRESRYQSAALFGTDIQSLYAAHNNSHLLFKKPDLDQRSVLFQKKKVLSLLALGIIALGGAGFLAVRYLGPFGSDASTAGPDHSAEDIEMDDLLRKLALATESGEGLSKEQKEIVAAVISAAVRDILELTRGSRKTEAGIVAADLLMQGGLEEDAQKLLEKLQAEAIPESMDWKRVNAMSQLLRVTGSGYDTAMAAADEARRTGDSKRERSCLARAAGYLSDRRELLARTQQNTYEPLPALLQVLKKMRNGTSGGPVKYAIRARRLELHVDLAGNNQLVDLTPLSQFPITHLDVSDTRVGDLSPLTLAPLQVLRADRTLLTTLSPVAKGPLRLVTAEGCAVTDDGSLDQARILANYRVTMRGGSLAKKESTAQWGKTWVNSLGMTFQPIIEQRPVLISRDETLIRDFLEARKAANVAPFSLPHPVASLGPVRPSAFHPITSISSSDAQSFCRWLTDKERTSGNISVRATYRLLTDEEWNRAAGYASSELSGKSPLPSSSPHYFLLSNLPASGPVTWLGGVAPARSLLSGTFRSPSGINDLGNGTREWCQHGTRTGTPGIRDLSCEWPFWNNGAAAVFPPAAAVPVSTAGQADVGFRIALELPPILW
jgi:serine/threonine protein kinase